MPSSADDSRIFVLIPSYRDPECHPTINDLFAKAAHPERITVGVCWQYDAAADAEYVNIPLTHPEQVKTVHFPLEQARGAGWARNEALKLAADEPYILQLQAHHRFTPGWDEELIAMLARCPSEKPAITGWLPGYVPPDTRRLPPGKTTRYFIRECNMKNDPQMVHLMFRNVDEASVRAAPPAACPSWVGNFLFARREMLAEVPFDPEIYFWGEEVDFSARAWTHGWDFFQFDRTVLFHYWDRDAKGAGEYRDFRNPRNVKTRKRLHHLFGLAPADDASATADLQHYALGTARPLADYWRFCGIEMPSGNLLPRARAGEWNMASASARPRIFVQIAAYRDPECEQTLKDLFAKAAHPERIFAGVCWQQAEGDAPFVNPRPEQVRVTEVEARESLGAGWARMQAGRLRRDEEYTLLIDAHMRFEPGWDETLVRAITRAPSDRPVISAFCSGYNPKTGKTDGPVRWRIRVNAMGGGGDPQMVHLTGVPASPGDPRGDLYPTPFCVFHFIFAPSATFNEVPIDPHILFWGDEISHSVRLWTHGYDIFQPDKSVAYHLWERGEVQKTLPYRPHADPRNKQSAARVKHLLGIKLSEDPASLRELERYGLGDKRELSTFAEFAGIDLGKRTAKPAALQGFWAEESLSSPVEQPAAEDAAKPRIFVNIAAYRDPECQHTVKELFESAAHPERIFVGICWQFVHDEDHYCFAVPYPRPAQVRVIEVDARESKGVCWARAQVQSLWQGEEYTLQIDSHMRFEKGWDETLIAMHRALPTQKAVLTTYPAGYTPPRQIPHRITFRLVAKEFDNAGIFTMNSRPVGNAQAPVKGAFAGACMLFGPGSIITDVPYDPKLYFFGEEITLSARLWTHGYDIYHPHKPVIYHFWERKARRTHFEDHQHWPKQNKLSFARVKHMLGTEFSHDPDITSGLERFGLGQARTLAEYQQFAGVDFASRHISPAAYEGRFGVESREWRAESRKSSPSTLHSPPSTANGSNGPRKVLETPDVIVYDDFLPQDVYDRVFDFVSQTEYQYINTQGKVKRVWDMTNGFPLRSEKNIFYHAEGTQKPAAPWVYPSKTPFDRFIEHTNRMVPEAAHLVGAEGQWGHYSVTAWIYPQGTGLSMHDDGSGVYTGAYVFFMNNEWRAHWGGLLLVLDHESNTAIQSRKKETNAYKFHMQKWLHMTEHDELAMESGLAQCIFPKANRMVFIHPDAFHMVTQVAAAAGDHVRMSLAGFFHRPKAEGKVPEAAGATGY